MPGALTLNSWRRLLRMAGFALILGAANIAQAQTLEIPPPAPKPIQPIIPFPLTVTPTQIQPPESIARRNAEDCPVDPKKQGGARHRPCTDKDQARAMSNHPAKMDPNSTAGVR